MYCILGLCFLRKGVCVREAGVGMSGEEEEKRLLGGYAGGSRPWVPQLRCRGEKGARGRGRVFQRGPGD